MKEKIIYNFEDLQDLVLKYQKENKQLKEDKKKAIEYIKENAWYMYKDEEEIIDRVGAKELLEILGDKK